MSSAECHDHLVEFYETETFLVDTVCAFLVPALRDGDAAIVVATGAHRKKFDTALSEAGIDVEVAASEGRYLAFDAAEVLSLFMVDGEPDATRFGEAIGVVMDQSSRGGRRMRVYGEMVALLLAGGDAASALALEDLWNDLAEARDFALLCAYPMAAFGDDGSAMAFQRICEQHTTVIPSEGYSLLADHSERSRAVAQLQQRAVGLQAEVVRLRGPESTESARGDHRDEAGQQRDEAGGHRDEAGDYRDEAGVHRDHAAEQRDDAAEERDRAAEQRDRAAERSESSEHTGSATDSLNRSALARREAASDRRRASQDRRAGLSERNDAGLDRGRALSDRRAGANERVQAELDRDTALADREAGASERAEAELDRDTALADRGASARDRESSSLDGLTGAYVRGAGFVELEREIARARRTEQPLVLAFVDVDHLKAINDSGGHAAGDRMLCEVANALRARLRSHDLIIRYGGDEFVCAISGLDMTAAAKRLALVNEALAEAPGQGSVTVGLAELQPDESADDVVARADVALYRRRQQQRRTMA